MSSEMDQEVADHIGPGLEQPGDPILGSPLLSIDAHPIPLAPTNADDLVRCKKPTCGGIYPKYMFARNSKTNTVDCKKTRLEESVKQKLRARKRYGLTAAEAQSTIISNLHQGITEWSASLSVAGIRVPDETLEHLQSHVRSYVMRKAVSQLSRRGYSSHSIPMLAAQDAANPLDPESARKEWKCLDVGPMDCPRAKCRPQRCTKCKVNRPLCFFLREKYLLGELDIFCHTYHKVRDAWKGNQGDFQRLHLLTRQAGIRQVRNDVEMHVSEWECRINTYHDKQFSNKAWSHVLERLQIGSAILVDSWLNDSSNAMSSDDQCASHDSMSMDTDTAQTSPDSSVNPVSTSSPQSSKKQPSPSMMLVIEETPPHSPRQRESIPEHMKDLDYMYDLYSGSYRASTGTGSSPSMSRSISRDPSPLVLDTGSSNVTSSQEDAASGSDDSQAGVGISVASDYAESSTCGEEADLVLQSSTDSEDNIDSERLSSITPDESSNTTPDDAARQESDFIETIDLEVAGFEGACTDQRNGLHKYDEFCTSIEVGIHRLEEELAKKRHKHHALRARRVSGIASFEAKKLKKQMNLEKRINDITYGQLQVLSEVQKVRADAHITQMIQKKKDLRDQWLKRLREAAM